MAIANALGLQLEAARATPALCRFNYDAMPSLTSLEPIHCRIVGFLLLIHCYTPWPWPLTLNICSVSPVTWWNSSPNLNAIEQSYCDFSVWPYDLEHVLSVALGSGIIFTKFDLRQLIRAWITAYFDAGTLCQAVTLTCDLLTLKVRGTSSVVIKVCTKLERNRVIPAELLIILQIFAHVMSRRDLDLWPLDIELLQVYGCHAFKLFAKLERNRIMHGWVIDDLARFRVQF